MVRFTPPPANIDSGTYSYLYQVAERLNLLLDTVENGSYATGSTQQIQIGGNNGGGSGSTEQIETLNKEYTDLKSLVIKNAAEVVSSLQTLSAKLTGDYVAISDFGSYVQQLSSYIEANPASVTQYYKFFSDLSSNVSELDNSFTDYKLSTEGYIRTGIVYYDGATPVYGVAVGQGLTTTVIDGVETIDQTVFRAIFTAQKLSFWQGSDEIAYVSNKKLYITDVNVSGALTIGGKWQVRTKDGGLVFQYLK